jgi:hypothetical protein
MCTSFRRESQKVTVQLNYCPCENLVNLPALSVLSSCGKTQNFWEDSIKIKVGCTISNICGCSHFLIRNVAGHGQITNDDTLCRRVETAISASFKVPVQRYRCSTKNCIMTRMAMAAAAMEGQGTNQAAAVIAMAAAGVPRNFCTSTGDLVLQDCPLPTGLRG